MGSFDAKYLDVPEEVLVTSMKEHQHYFVSVIKMVNSCQTSFQSVTETQSIWKMSSKEMKKVLVARLEDGEFFWREDQKLVISDLVEKLNNVTFHEKIGSLREHMIRTGQIAVLFGRKSWFVSG